MSVLRAASSIFSYVTSFGAVWLARTALHPAQSTQGSFRLELPVLCLMYPCSSYKAPQNYHVLQGMSQTELPFFPCKRWGFLSLHMTVIHPAPKLPHLPSPGSRPSQFCIILQITLLAWPHQSSHLEAPAAVYLLVLLPELLSRDLLCTLP